MYQPSGFINVRVSEVVMKGGVREVVAEGIKPPRINKLKVGYVYFELVLLLLFISKCNCTHCVHMCFVFMCACAFICVYIYIYIYINIGVGGFFVSQHRQGNARGSSSLHHHRYAHLHHTLVHYTTLHYTLLYTVHYTTLHYILYTLYTAPQLHLPSTHTTQHKKIDRKTHVFISNQLLRDGVHVCIDGYVCVY